MFEHIQQIPYSHLIKQQINWPFCSFCWFVGLQDVREPSKRLVKKWSSYSVVDHACLKGRAYSCKSNLTNTTSWRKAEEDFEPNICHPFSSMICNIGTLVWHGVTVLLTNSMFSNFFSKYSLETPRRQALKGKSSNKKRFSGQFLTLSRCQGSEVMALFTSSSTTFRRSREIHNTFCWGTSCFFLPIRNQIGEMLVSYSKV